MMNHNILIVDDDPGSIQIMGRILSGVGQLRFATTGEDALRLARESAPDLMLLDAEMPGMTGIQAFEALKAEPKLADVPVIFVTSHSEAEFEVAVFDKGAVFQDEEVGVEDVRTFAADLRRYFLADAQNLRPCAGQGVFKAGDLLPDFVGRDFTGADIERGFPMDHNGSAHDHAGRHGNAC